MAFEAPLASVPVLTPVTESDRAIRMAVINNPRSGNNRRGNRLATISETLEREQVRHVEAYEPQEIARCAQELLFDGTELIVINGGDGTVQAVLTGLFRAGGKRRAPILTVLPGGTTNTTARNVGYGGIATEGLRELVAEAGRGRLSGRLDERRVLRVDHGAGEPLFAMFFGAGAVYHGIRFAKEQVESRGLRGQAGAGVALAVFVSKIATGQGRTLFPPLNARVALDGEWREEESLRGLLVSTMDRQFLGIRPYWGDGPGAIWYSSLAYQPRHFARALLPVMRGKPNRFCRPEFGYRSQKADRVELLLDSGFTLDGELFLPEPGASVDLSAECRAFFLRRRGG